MSVGVPQVDERPASTPPTPRAWQPVPLTIRPGDQIALSITQQGSGQWLIWFSNNTTGQTYQLTVTDASSLSSAEWVVEAPSAARGRVMSVEPLDDFGTVVFEQASATRDGQSLTIAQAGGSAIDLISRANQVLADASPLGADGASFSVKRTPAASFGVYRAQ